MQSQAHYWKELSKLYNSIGSRSLLLYYLPSSEGPQLWNLSTFSEFCARRGVSWQAAPCSTIIVGREVSSCPLSSSYSTVKISIFEDLELLQEFQRRTEPERAILARIMYELERIHFACILPTKINPENGETLNLLEHWFPLRFSSEDLRFKEIT